MSASALTERASVTLDTYVVDIAWSRDGRSLAVAGGEGGVVLVENVAGQAASARARRARHGRPSRWRGSPGTQVVASSGQDSARRAVGYRRCAAVLKRLRPGTAWTEHLAYSPDGKLLATATGKVLSLWDGAGELVHRFEPHAATIAAFAWDKPGRDLAAATQGAVCVHRIEPPQFSLRRYTWPAACLTAAFSPNGKFLASGTQDGTVHFWISPPARIRRCAATARR